MSVWLVSRVCVSVAGEARVCVSVAGESSHSLHSRSDGWVGGEEEEGSGEVLRHQPCHAAQKTYLPQTAGESCVCRCGR